MLGLLKRQGILRTLGRLHRKQWEFVFLLRAMERLGVLAPGKRAIVPRQGSERRAPPVCTLSHNDNVILSRP